jgi:monovalent cation:H+ antiporter-2, CPA2 family
VAAPIDIATYSDVLVLLGTAAVVIPLLHRLGVNTMLGYLGAGAVLGPLGLGSLISEVPFLYWVTVVEAENVASIAELGIVFRLFLIGMELSFERLKTMRRLLFGMGSLQIVVTTTVIGGIAMLFGNPPSVAVVLGACLALSSTAIVIELLSQQGRLSTTVGRTSLSVLLAQDLAVVPLLVFVSILGARDSDSMLAGLMLAVVNASIAILLIVVLGRLLLRPLFRLVASVGASGIFVAAALFVIIGTGVTAALAGLSMALGAFIAGLLLAESEFRRAIETTIGPFKGLLLGLFFFTVGMNIDFREVIRDPFWLLASVFGLIAIKAGILIVLGRVFGLSRAVSIETGLLLGPGGEFAFIVLGLATSVGVIPGEVASFMIAVTSLTMALIPLLSFAAQRMRGPGRVASEARPVPEAQPGETVGKAIVIGYGRVGKVVCAMLDQHGLPYLAVDTDVTAVSESRADGRKLFYGDASNPDFLVSCGVMDAKAVIITIAERAVVDEIVVWIRSVRSDIVIISRARDAEHARHLYTVGVTDAVPETIEASLQLSESSLLGMGQPAAQVNDTIHARRDAFRRELQKAAAEAKG